MAQQFAGKEGKYVKLADSLEGCDESCNGGADSLPEQAFLYVGGLDEVREKAKDCCSFYTGWTSLPDGKRSF